MPDLAPLGTVFPRFLNGHMNSPFFHKEKTGFHHQNCREIAQKHPQFTILTNAAAPLYWPP
jgi:hypothetical protein